MYFMVSSVQHLRTAVYAEQLFLAYEEEEVSEDLWLSTSELSELLLWVFA